MCEKDKILEVVKQFIEETLLRGNTQGSLETVADDVIGVGMGEQGTVAGKDDVRRILEQGNYVPGITYSIHYEETHARCFSGEFGVADVRFALSCIEGEKTTVSRYIQSASAKKENGKWKLCFLQIVPLGITEHGIEVYPLKYADNGLTQFGTELRTEAFKLASQRLSGGVFGTYIEEPVYPLYFANDSMMGLLGYTRDEFIEKFNKDAAISIHPGDKARVLKKITRSISEDKEFEIQFRMVRKDGSIIWVIERGKKTVSDEGRDIILGVFTDISDIMRMQELLEEKTVLLEEQAEELAVQNEELYKQREVLEEQAKSLAVSEERFRIALQKTSNRLFDYDVASGNIILIQTDGTSESKEIEPEKMKDRLFKGGKIQEEYLEGFLKMIKQIGNGCRQSECIIKVKMEDGRICWHQVTVNGIAGPGGNILRAVGFIEDVTRQKEIELAYQKEEQYRKTMLSDAEGIYVINYSKGIFESCQIKSDYCAAIEEGDVYDPFLKYCAKTRLGEKDRKRFLDTFLSPKVLAAFKEGRKELRLEYLSRSSDKSERWMQTVLRLVIDSTTNEKKGFLYVFDIQERKERELALTIRLETDSLTGIYNKEAVEKYIKEYLEGAGPRPKCAFLMIDIDRFKEVNDCYGHPFGDKVLREAGQIFQKEFQNNSIVGRLGGDEFCIFLNRIKSKESLAEAVSELCEKIGAIEVPFRKEVGISCSIGISLCNGQRKSFEELYKEADVALYRVKDRGKNGYTFFDDCNTEETHQWIKSAEWLLDEVQVGMYVSDKETYDIIYVNNYLLDYLGIERADCYGKKCYEALLKRDSPCDFCALSMMKEKEAYERIFTVPGKDRIMLLRGQLIEWSQGTAHLEIASDITDILKRL